MSEEDFDVQGFARDLNELLVLSALRDEKKHGYQIALDIEDESRGLVKFRHGTLYPILHRLESEGSLRGSWSRGEGRRRKIYGLTAAGRRRLTGGASRVEDVVGRLLAVLRNPGEAPA